MAGQDGLHGRLQGLGERRSPGGQAQRRGRRARRSGRPRWRAARRLRLPARLVSPLGTGARTRRLRLRAVRRELHDRGAGRRRGLRRRPLPDRQRRLRGHAAARDVLPGRDPHGRPAHSGSAGLPPSPGLLLPRAGRGRGAARSADRQARVGPGTDDGGRAERAALPARPSAPGTASRAAHPRAQRRLAGVVPRVARRSAGHGQRGPDGGEPAPRRGPASAGSPSGRSRKRAIR